MSKKLLERSDFTSDEAYEKYLKDLGLCPKCRRKIKGYTPPFGSFAPEMWATIREHGIDPGTNHESDCPNLYKY